MSLAQIAQQTTIYAGFSITLVGLVGNGINIFVFSTVRGYRQTPCTFYFLIASIFNLLYVAINLPTRVFSVGFGSDLTRTSLAWCKIRQFTITTFPLMTLTCLCFATIDQFCATSPIARLRRLSNIKMAHRITYVIAAFSLIYGATALVFYHIPENTHTCLYTDYGYSIFALFYLFGQATAIPALTMSIFGYLTYRNIHRIRAVVEQRADRQLVRMILIQVFMDIFFCIPYGINALYVFLTLNIKKDPDRLAIESFVGNMIGLFSYLYYAISCYMFLITSSRFRRAARDRILVCFRPMAIVPV